MEPVLKMWLYEHWLGDHRDEAELAKNHAYLLGSFWNSEAVREMMNDNIHESTDEDLAETMKMVENTDLRAVFHQMEEQKPKRRRRRANLKE